jgi:hypothetical protein
VPGMLRHLEARRQAEYDRRKAATQKASAIKAEAEEILRQKMENPRNKPPERLTRQEKLLLAEKYRKKRKLLSLVR